ncbi:MAG: hypothetical protein H0W02_23040 [Ktedonobacteraceae bacterium]|nr:hypothetical protein [Ktedonobacteraceae bacterium]
MSTSSRQQRKQAFRVFECETPGEGRLLNREGKEMLERDAISTQRSTSPPLSAFLSQARQYWHSLQEEKLALIAAYQAFSRGKNVWPDQCGRTVVQVEAIDETVRVLCGLLADEEQLPLSVVPYRHLPLAALWNMTEQIRILLPLITTFRRVCKNPSRQRDRLHSDIERKLESLIRDCQETLRYVYELFDQVRLREGK